MENLVDESIPAHRETPASSSRELASEPWGKVVSDKHSIYTHVPKGKDCDICQRTKITRAPRRGRNGGAVLRVEIFEDWITADHKVVSDNCESRNNHRYAVVTQDLASQWIQSYPCKTKTYQETGRSLQKYLEPNSKPKVIVTDNPLEFSKAREDLSWNHCTSTQIGNQWDCWKNGTQDSGRHICSIVAIRSGWKMAGGCHGMLLLSAKHSRSLVWWEDSIWKAVRKAIWRTCDTVWSNGRIPPISAEDLSRLHQFGPKVLPCIFLGYALHEGRVRKKDIFVADIEELVQMDASEIYAKRNNATRMSGEKFIFPIAEGTGKHSGRDQALWTSISILDRPVRGEEQDNL